jgi:4'-phosphopantetheinyl transferase
VLQEGSRIRNGRISSSVQIFHLHTKGFDCSLPGEILNTAERERAARYKFDEDRQRFMAARATLRQLLAGETGISAADLVIQDAENRKPRLVLPQNAAPPFFNVSHSGDHALIAVSRDAEVGVDIEQVRQDCPVEDLARRYYAPAEYDWLRSLPLQRRIDAFYRLWTIKEAVLKCVGLGLSLPPASVHIRLSPKSPPVITCADAAAKNVERFFVRELRVIDGYAAAVAVDAPNAEVIARPVSF